LGILLLAMLGGYCQPIEVDRVVVDEAGSLYPISDGELVQHTHFQLAYSEHHEGAYWVFYCLTQNMLKGTAIRKDNFMPDPKVSTFSASPDDYIGSGYDRGHLCPAASMVVSQQAMDETFYMSNMSPQHPGLNRGRWKSLETKEREWANLFDTIYIATGAIYSDSLGTIGKNQVTIPRYYYKILWDGDTRLIGFVMPNEKCPDVLEDYVVPVDSIERLTGIDFFSIIPDKTETHLEEACNSETWFSPALTQSIGQQKIE
jgi:endonuclease G, mitochondrial